LTRKCEKHEGGWFSAACRHAIVSNSLEIAKHMLGRPG